MEIIIKAIRAFFTNIDSHIYYLIKVVYNLIIDLANVKLFSDTTLNDFATRVYTLLGIFMLFKITFSFISYIINPDKMLDKTSGVQNIIKNVVVALIMIIIAPRAFDLLYEAQSAILDDNILPRFIVGTESDVNSTSDLSIYMYSYDTGSNSEDSLNSDPCGTNGIFIAASQADYINLMILRNFFKPESDMDATNLMNSLNRTDDGPKNYCNPTDLVNENLPSSVTAGSFLDNSTIFNSYKFGKQFAINYSFIISTAVPTFVLLIYISIAFDIAVRAIKLSFLQLIAPIPIISYIDPNSGKNGMFKKWLVEVGKTWANLFIRLASVYFAVYVIQQISNSNFPMFYNESYKPKSGTFWIQLFVLIGALMFAKQLPQLLETLIPGLKTSGSFQLNPFKKIANDTLGGKYLAGAAVAGGVGAAGALAGGKAKYDALRNTGHGIIQSIARGALMGGIGGGIRSTGRTIMTGSDGSISGMRKAMSTGFASAGHGAQNIYAKDGTSFFGRNVAKLQTNLGLDTSADVWDKTAKNYEDLESQMKILDTRSDDYLKKHSDLNLSDGRNYAEARKQQENILNGKTIKDDDIAVRDEAKRRVEIANSVLSRSTSSLQEKQRAMNFINKYSELANSSTAAEQIAAQTEISKMEKEAKQLARIQMLGDSTLDSEFNVAIDNILSNKDYADLEGYDDIVRGITEESQGNVTSSIKDGRTSAKVAVQRIPIASKTAKDNKAYATRNKK